MTFNILTDLCIDFKNPEEYYDGIDPEDLKIKNRINTIISVIKKNKCDVYVLQEVTESVKKILKKEIVGYKFMPMAEHDIFKKKSEEYGNLTIISEDYIQALQLQSPCKVTHKKLYLHKEGTVYSIVKIENAGSSVNGSKKSLKSKVSRSILPITIINIHLDSNSHKLRMEEAKAVLDYIGDNGVFIIAGDFNSNDKSLHKLFKAASFNTLEYDSKIGTYLCESPVIDFIYVRGASMTKLKLLNCNLTSKMAKSKCMKNTIKYIGSDHYPLVADIKFEK